MNSTYILFNHESCSGQSPAQSSVTLHDRVDLLVSRIADGEAGTPDWNEFEALAQRHPEAWRTLAEAQRQNGALCLAVGVALHSADRVDMPMRRAGGETGGWRIPNVRAWGGWAVAAMLGLALIGSRSGGLIQRAVPGTETQEASLIPAGWTTQDARNAYYELGKKDGSFVGEVPQKLLLEVRPSGKGYEAVVVRQIIERTHVPEFMRVGIDESGRYVPVRMSAPTSPVEIQPD